MKSRILGLILTLFLVFCATRGLIRFLPGDPLETLMAETGTSLPREVLREELHLDRPFAQSIAADFKAALRGDLGRSIFTRQPIAPVLGERFVKTLQLTAVSMALGLFVSLTLGLLACAQGRVARAADRFCTFYGALTAALPTPWIGPMLAYLLAVQLRVFPLGNHLALPALTLALAFSGLWSRLIRERVRETLLLGAAPGARARGIGEARVLVKYGLAPASGALLAYLGTQTGALMAGAFVTEVIFDWPGMGSLFVEAVLRRDYPVIESAAFAGAAAALLGTALGDFAQHRIDPRGPAR